jgi:phosphatidylserine/phosphatidylglycerophosphate/cardiolipin synthase-like enzyme
MTSIIRKENSWSTNQATRASLLIDGENYFRALTEAIKSAKQNIFILSWDIDSRIQLLRGDEK